MRNHLRAAVVPALIALGCGVNPAAHPPAGEPGGGGSGGAGGLPEACRQTVSIQQEGCLDLGAVRLGLEATRRTITVGNPGDVPVDVCTGIPDDDFSVTPARLTIPPGGEATMDVRFFPRSRGPHEADLQLGACTASCPRPLGTVCLRGAALVEAFTLEPDPVDFGVHLPGTTTCKDITVRNTGDVSIYVRDIRTDDALDRVPGTFSIRLGDILNDKEIEAGASGTFQLCFTPAKEGASYSGNLVVSTDGVVQKVAVRGRGGAARIAAVPDRLDLGVNVLGRAVTRRVMLTRVGEPTLLAVTGVEWTPGDGSLEVQHPALPYNVGRAGEMALDVTFVGVTPGDHAGSITVAQQNEAGTTDTISIPVTARVLAGDPCNLIIRPAEVSFGFVHAGKNPETGEQEVYRKDVRIRNAGASECVLWDLGLDPGGSSRFTAGSGPGGILAIPPGEELTVTVVYTPIEPSIDLDRSSLMFKQVGDPDVDPQVVVPISGFASALCLRVESDPVDFGRVPLGHAAVRPLNLTSCTPSLLKIGGKDPANPPARGWNGDVAFSAGSSPAFSLRGVPPLPYSMPADTLLKLDVVHEPTSIGPDHAQLEIWLRSALAPIVVDAFGEGVDEACGELCEAPQATCPAAQSAWVQHAVGLPGFAKDDADGENPPGGANLTCAWTVEEAPPASVNLPADPTGCSTTFRPDQEGDYRLRLTVTDGDGRTGSCTADVRAEPYDGLWIETTWSAPDDVDLHLFHADAGDVLDPATWFNLPYDCHFSNMSPHWDSYFRVDDPHLVRDDEVGTGPEIIRIDSPSTAHAYEIGVHWFADPHHASGQDVTTRIYCGSALASSIDTTLEALHQAAWVASLEWGANASCKVTRRSGVLEVIP